MKTTVRFILLATVILLSATTAQGKIRKVSEKDSLGNVKRVIELRDTVIDGKSVADTLSIMTYETEEGAEASDGSYAHHYDSGADWEEVFSDRVNGVLIPLLGLILCFGFPLFLLFIIFYFRYKNRKAKYRLLEQAIAAGRPLPPDFFKSDVVKDMAMSDIRSKGIKNIFLGIGLFIFLWAITTEFSIGCIGLLIMFTGFGQVVIYYTQDKQSRPASGNDYHDASRQRPASTDTALTPRQDTAETKDEDRQ